MSVSCPAMSMCRADVSVLRRAPKTGSRSPLAPYVVGMRWETLFADMEAQLAAADRAERATVHLADRLRESVGRSQRVRIAGGEPLEGDLVDVADQWLLLAQGAERR